MSLFITLLGSHLLTLVENELIAAEPAIVNLVIQEVELLISKLENLLAGKAPKIAAVANPALTAAGATAVNMVQAAGEAAIAGAA